MMLVGWNLVWQWRLMELTRGDVWRRLGETEDNKVLTCPQRTHGLTNGEETWGVTRLTRIYVKDGYMHACTARMCYCYHGISLIIILFTYCWHCLCLQSFQPTVSKHWTSVGWVTGRTSGCKTPGSKHLDIAVNAVGYGIAQNTLWAIPTCIQKNMCHEDYSRS